MTCKYLADNGICVNGDCPYCADYCPVTESPEVCRFNPANERTGRWIEDGDYQICSECGEEHEWGDYRASYCDSCGAKMDGEA